MRLLTSSCLRGGGEVLPGIQPVRGPSLIPALCTTIFINQKVWFVKTA
jgi:hypothetical protein